MNIYDLVLKLLREDESLRDSDKLLIWEVWTLELDAQGMDVITLEQFLKVATPESITRARRKVQENHPELRASDKVQEARVNKEQTKGTFIFEEDTKTRQLKF